MVGLGVSQALFSIFTVLFLIKNGSRIGPDSEAAILEVERPGWAWPALMHHLAWRGMTSVF